MGDNSSTPQNTTTTQTNEPWSVSKPWLSQAMQEAGYLYQNDLGFKPWMGATQAALNPLSTQALDWTKQLAQGGSSLIDNTFGGLSQMMGQGGLSDEVRSSLEPFMATARGDFLKSPNPYLSDMLTNQGNQIKNQVASTMSGAGRYGSGAHADIMSRAISESTLPILAQNYENERGRQLSAAQGLTDTYTGGLDRMLRGSAMAPSIEALRYDPASRLGAVGDFYGARDQYDLNSLIERWNQAESRPWDQLGRANAIFTGIGQMGGTGTTVKPVTGPSTAQQAVGGALAGAGLGSTFGPWGAGIGAGLGGLAGLLL